MTGNKQTKVLHQTHAQSFFSPADIRWVNNWSAVIVEAVFESSFSFTYVLFGAVVALYHVNDVFRVTVNVISDWLKDNIFPTVKSALLFLSYIFTDC